MYKKYTRVDKGISYRRGELGDAYRVRITWKKKVRVQTFSTLAEAVAWRDETTAILRAGGNLEGEVPPGDMRLGEASDKFIEKAKADRAPNTISGYQWAQKQVLLYFGENRLLSSITQESVHDFVTKRRNKDKVGISKIRQELSFIRLVYEASPAWGVNFESPEKNIPRPVRKRQSREDRLDRIIKPEEMTALFFHAFDMRLDLFCYLLFLLHTGMRPSEAATLRWQRLSLKNEKQELKERRPIGFYDEAREGFSMVGTKTATRFVPLHPIAKWVLDTMPKENQFVFLPDDHGQHHQPHQFFRWAFRRLKKEAGVRDNIDFYSFRHTARSRMATCGLQDSAAETIIGHEGNKMMMTYTHYQDEDLVKEIQKLEYPWLHC